MTKERALVLVLGRELECALALASERELEAKLVLASELGWAMMKERWSA
eukprot:CAMPEP_0171840960 /NCGR_PEP_ID=MMETSP0992-20121227/14283_1 /TAXON_ID=483369 /ORGANISM="non described non described, Strain CCMP2098" /LENGTH=48 /DNA_ID= /DNA_START= /DNA_END= /DNA_ORIENTATION=